MDIRFELENELGLDQERISMPSLVVSTQKPRTVYAVGQEGPWQIENSNETVAKARVVKRRFNKAEIEVTPVKEGTCVLYVSQGSTRRGSDLFVHVVQPHDVSVNFHFFTSGASRTTFTRAQAVALVNSINGIYEPQSFIKFRIHLMNPVNDDDLYALDFATTDQSDDSEQLIWDTLRAYLRKNFPTKSQRNVFCVRRWGARDITTCPGCNRNVLGTNPIGGNLAVIETGIANAPLRMPQLLAHELGHSFKLQHDGFWPNNLMQPKVDTQNILIREIQAFNMGQSF